MQAAVVGVQGPPDLWLAMFLEEIEEIRAEILEARNLDTVQREVNPLKKAGPNPIKTLVKTFRKAKRTKKPDDIAATKNAHRVGAMYADHHGLPRLEKAIIAHMKRIPAPRKPEKKLVKPEKKRAKPDAS